MSVFLVDSYDVYPNIALITGGGGTLLYKARSQSFTGKAGDIVSCTFSLKINTGSPTGNITAKLYAHTGTYGVSSSPTGAALATSDVVDIETLTTSYELITFNFTGAEQYTLVKDTKYCIAVEFTGGDNSNTLGVGADYLTTSGNDGHGGSIASQKNADDAWVASSLYDIIFYVYAEGTEPVDASAQAVSVAKPIQLKTTKEINGAWTANLQILPDDYIETESYVTIANEDYIVRNLKRIKSGGKSYYDVWLEHNCSELADLTIESFYLTQPVDDILDYILDGTTWIAGTIDIDETVMVNTDRRTSRMEALVRLAERCSGELYFDSSARTVDLKRKIGTHTGLHIRYDKNATYIEKEEDSTSLVTRIYPYGPDGYTINTTLLDNCDDESLWAASGGASIAASTSIKMQGSQGIECVAAALDETFTRDLGAGNVIDLTGHTSAKISIYSAVDNASGYTFGIGEAAYTDIAVATGALIGGCWHEIELDLSATADASKNAIRYLGIKNLTDGAATCVIDWLRAYDDDIYIDSENITQYKVNKEYAFYHSARVEKTQHEVIIYPSDDSYIYQGSKNTNYGSQSSLKVRDYGSVDFISFVKFALTQIPTGATITEAILNLYVSATQFSSGGTVDIKLPDANWAESTITWNNAPGNAGNVSTFDGNSTGLKEITITSTVQDWWSGAEDNYGVKLELNIADTKKTVTLSSKEGANPPYLKVQYTVNTDPAPVIEAAAREYLDKYDEPILKYRVKMVDLSEVMVGTWESETINLGDTVRVYDSDLDINTDCRVKKITKDLLEPGNTEIELTNKAYNIADLQAKIQKQVTYLMPFNDDDRLGYANTIGVGYLGGEVNV